MCLCSSHFRGIFPPLSRSHTHSHFIVLLSFNAKFNWSTNNTRKLLFFCFFSPQIFLFVLFFAPENVQTRWKWSRWWFMMELKATLEHTGCDTLAVHWNIQQFLRSIRSSSFYWSDILLKKMLRSVTKTDRGWFAVPHDRTKQRLEENPVVICLAHHS